MTRDEFNRMRGIVSPSPSGGDVPIEVGTVDVNETTLESAGAETPADGLPPGDGAFAGVETETPDEEPLAGTDTEPTGSRNRRRSTG